MKIREDQTTVCRLTPGSPYLPSKDTDTSQVGMVLLGCVCGKRDNIEFESILSPDAKSRRWDEVNLDLLLWENFYHQFREMQRRVCTPAIHSFNNSFDARRIKTITLVESADGKIKYFLILFLEIVRLHGLCSRL